MIFITLFLIFIAVAAFVLGVAPLAVDRGSTMAQNSAAQFVAKYDAVLNDNEIKKMRQRIIAFPLIFAAAAFLLSPDGAKLNMALVGLAAGFIFPRFQLNHMLAARKRKFADQLTDALMIMSSSFRGGLSLIQAVESVVEEMPDPAKQEFGIVLGENKMGVPLDESLNRLYQRLPSPALQQMVTAILLARETGGNLAIIFSRIINTVRERRKIEGHLQTLTVQGKIQAVVMTGLPVLFYMGVSTSNPRFFDSMLHTPDGQKLMTICIVLWVLGAVSIWRISTFKDL